MVTLNYFQVTVEVSVLIVVVSLVSILIKKLSPNVKYFLWIFVALRILVPLKGEVSFTLPEKTEETIEVLGLDSNVIILDEREDYIKDAVEVEEQIGLEVIEGGEDRTLIKSLKASYLEKRDSGDVLRIAWLAGGMVVTIFVLLNNIRLYREFIVKRKRVGKLSNGITIYSMPGYNCLMGVIFPAIYVDVVALASSNVIKYVIKHELQHYKVKDHIWQMLRIVCLVLQWYNPFVWWAYYASKRASELACDYRVTRTMTNEEKYEYGNSLLAVAECMLLKRQSVYLTSSIGESKEFIKKRINVIMQQKFYYTLVGAIIIIGVIGTISLVSPRIYIKEDANYHQILEKKKNIIINIQEYYVTNTGDSANLYYIDENKVLWGCGQNIYGQLGQGTQDNIFYEQAVKIAENVIHVDYSQEGFMVYLTEDNELYGVGNAGVGALQQFEDINREKYVNDEYWGVTTPYLLMENVIYARCGRSDIACITTEGEIWIWGTIGYVAQRFYFEPYPVKVLENAVLITGGLYNHAALLGDGSVWTWGYNYSGNCGVEGTNVVSTPTKVADDVIGVWTGNIKYNVDCYDISEFEGIYERQYENTIIQKRDGSYWICGANVGDSEKILPLYYETMDYVMRCTHEFQLLENEIMFD